jgi:hypothetical protein
MVNANDFYDKLNECDYRNDVDYRDDSDYHVDGDNHHALLTDTRMLKLGLRPRYSQKRNI